MDHGDIPDGELGGVVSIDWTKEDLFIYRPRSDPLWFQPSFLKATGQRIVPVTMHTDGGSVPRIFWNIPGLSPWALGPAYVIHDYIFAVHRCGWYDPVVSQITFEQSAEILAEVGKALIAHGLVKHDALNAIIWAVRTRYARDIWDKPGDAVTCATPKKSFAAGDVRVMEFRIPPRRR